MPKDIKYKIAIIEDDKVLSKALGEKLIRAGFDIIQAYDGEEGLWLVLKEKPDLILLDIVMAKMDGMNLLKKLRNNSQNEWAMKVPVIILTNLNADDNITRGVARDEPAYYLVKTDYTIDQVIEKVNECLGTTNK